MPPQVTLIYRDDEGREARAVVPAPRFQIGRGADCDLVISDTNLSRRHVMIERIGDAAFVSDCGSQNGTTVNGEPVTGAVELRDGDILTLANARSFKVRIERAAAIFASGASTNTSGPSQSPTPMTAKSRGRPAWLNPIVVAPSAAMLLLLMLGVALLAFKHSRDASRDANENDLIESARTQREPAKRGELASKATNDATASGAVGAARPSASDDARANASEAATPARAVASDSDDLSRDIKRVMSRISNDSAPYISAQGIKDVTAKVRGYRGSTALRDRLRSMQRACGDVSALARNDKLNPTLVMYAAIAESESGGTNDPATVARQMLPKLLTLSSTFGTASANSSLLLVAAYPYPFEPEIGSRERRAHPLATKLVQYGGSHGSDDPSIARTVWYLRERDAVTPEAYDLVVRLLAVGIVAENPARFGVDSPPLLC
jgi:hypothetical protein